VAQSLDRGWSARRNVVGAASAANRGSGVKLERCRFLTKAGGATAVAAAAISGAPNDIAQPKIVAPVDGVAEATRRHAGLGRSPRQVQALVGPWDQVAQGVYHQLSRGERPSNDEPKGLPRPGVMVRGAA
jgi:hypothetical protein